MAEVQSLKSAKNSPQLPGTLNLKNEKGLPLPFALAVQEFLTASLVLPFEHGALYVLGNH